MKHTSPRIRALQVAVLLVFALIALSGLLRRVSRAEVTVLAAPRMADSSAIIRFVKNPEPAPTFQVRDLSGKTYSSADWKGKVVILNFWATWCPPCRKEIPEFIALQKQYKDRLQIVGASEDEDTPEKVMKFAQQKGINYPVMMATPQLIAAYGGVPALPTSFLIDPQGRVVQKHSGLFAYEVYDREIKALLGMPVDAPIETFVDTGQVFLKNAANATELPGVNFTGLSANQKKTALHRLNAESCTCGCGLTLSQCRVNDTECPVSTKIAAQVVQESKRGIKSAPTPRAKRASGTAD